MFVRPLVQSSSPIVGSGGNCGQCFEHIYKVCPKTQQKNMFICPFSLLDSIWSAVAAVVLFYLCLLQSSLSS